MSSFQDVHVKEEPRTHSTICFVCGSPGADYQLNSKPINGRGPFFPFLEHHQPPRGAERPNFDGCVSACVVCFSFLNQQWEAFERTRTPLHKRLYWLKRTDNGPYAGMEVAMQSEYANQYLGVTVQGNSDYSGQVDIKHQSAMQLIRDDALKSYRQHERSDSRESTSSNSLNSRTEREAPCVEDQGALDLSLPSRTSSRSSSTLPSPPLNVHVCYVCGEECPKNSLVNVYAKPIANCPYFPTLMNHPKPLKARGMDVAGRVLACEGCHRHLLQQWDAYQRHNVPNSERSYQVQNTTSMQPPAAANPSRNMFICYTCGLEFPETVKRIASVCPNADGEPVFPFLEQVVPPAGAYPISPQGKAIICSVCYKSMVRQLRVHELSGVPEGKRTYKIPNTSHNGKDSRPYQNDGENPESAIACYLCQKLLHPDKLYPVDTQPQNSVVYFPFLQEVSKPSLSQAMDSFGRVLLCHTCRSTLIHQWESFEASNIPQHQRHYSITLPVKDAPESHNIPSHLPANPGCASSTESTLHIQVSSPDVQLDISQPLSNLEPLLTTVSTLSQNSIITSQSSISSGHGQSPHTLEMTPSMGSRASSKSVDDGHSQSSESQGVLRIYGPLEYPPAKQPLLVATTCFICGEYSSPGYTYPIQAFRPQGTSVHQSEDPQNAPFFPFLTKHTPPSNERLSEDGTTLVCSFCFHSLMAQWLAYETSPHAEDSNQWQRKYNTHHYVCYICGITTYRKRVRCITVRDFPFLMEHPRPAGALTLSGGESVVTCLTCFESLTSQWKDFERMKVPVEMRKYNWIVLPPPPEAENSVTEQAGSSREEVLSSTSSSGRGHGTEVTRSSNSSYSDDRSNGPRHDFQNGGNPTHSNQQGLPHGSKPPPLTMQPPGSTTHKPVARTMATVSPLYQVVPHSNNVITNFGTNTNPALTATRTSSFAAALRKLAKQAGDPIADKELSPITPVSSPALNQRSTTPKRVAPVPYLSNHQSSISVSSPPVVTIAPTQTHISHLTDSRKSLDSLSLNHGNSSSNNHITEPLSLKLDSSKTGSHSYLNDKREDSLSGTKELHVSSSLAQVRPTATVSSTVHHEDILHSSRGFQPYRGLDDMRHPLPPHIPSYDPAAAAAAAAAAAYPYHPAFLPSHHMPHPAYRLDDPLYLERYGLLRPPMMHIPPPPQGVLSHPAVPFGTGGRYPPELLAHPLSLVSPNSTTYHQDRLKLEQEQRQRDRDLLQEREREREREKEREREREREQEMEREREREKDREAEAVLSRSESGHIIHSPLAVPSTRHSESPGPPMGCLGSITQGTPRDLIVRKSSTPSLGTGPLNLTTHATVPSQEHHRPHHLESNLPLHSSIPYDHHRPSSRDQDEGLAYRHSLLLQQQEIHHQQQTSSELLHPVNRVPERRPEDPRDRNLVKHSIQGHTKEKFVHSDYLYRRAMADNSLPPYVNSHHNISVINSNSNVNTIHSNLEDSPMPTNTPSSIAEPESTERTIISTSERRNVIAADGRIRDSAEKSRRITSHPPDPWLHDSHKHHEGMHARLIEAEKSANENLVNSHVRHEFRTVKRILECESGPQNLVDYGQEREVAYQHRPPLHNHIILPALTTTTTTTVMQGSFVGGLLHNVRSKLDLEEEKIRKARIAGTYQSDDSDREEEEESDENRLSRLMFITKGPALPLDANPQKLQFLGIFGLTTYQKKNDIEFKKYCRRKKVLKERIPLIEVEEEETTSSLPEPSPIVTESLCHSPDYPEKVSFLKMLDLFAATPEQKENKERIWKAIVEERTRRRGLKGFLICRKSDLCKKNQRDSASPKSLKRRLENIHPNGLVFDSVRCNDTYPPPVKVAAVVGQPVSSATLLPPKQKHNVHKGSLAVSKSMPPSSSVPPHSIVHPQPLAQVPITQQSRPSIAPDSHKGNKDTSRERRVVIFSDPTSQDPQARQLGKDFAQEFYDSVLQTTKQQLEQSRPKALDSSSQGHSSQSQMSLSSSSSSSSSTSLKNSSSLERQTESESTKDSEQERDVYRWPGVEVVMEAYERYVQEQKLEKEVLQEQWQHLQKYHQDLKIEADRVTQRVSELVNLKICLDRERDDYQNAIDSLKRCLRSFR